MPICCDAVCRKQVYSQDAGKTGLDAHVLATSFQISHQGDTHEEQAEYVIVDYDIWIPHYIPNKSVLSTPLALGI